MNREVLYRGKTDDGEWVYGNLIETREEYSDEIVYAILEKTAEHRYGGEYGDDGWNSVAKDTIGEYTGLTDKHGNKIFTGDIVKLLAEPCNSNYAKKGSIGVVVFDEEFIGFYIDFSHLHYGDSENLANMRYANCEIVGNIYDNPELLTDKT